MLSLAAMLLVVTGANASTLATGGGARALAAACGTDDFDGTALDDVRWDVLRPSATAPLTVDGGKLTLPFTATDLIGGTASAANLVLQDAPTGGWTATTKFNIAQIDANGEQAGLALWKSEGPNSFAKVTFIQTNAGARQFEAIWTENGGTAVPTGNSGTPLPAGVPADADVLLRLRSDGYNIVAEYSVNDGGDWTAVGQPGHFSSPLRVGVLALGNSTSAGSVPFENFTLTCGPELTASTTRGAAPLTVDFTSTENAATWDFGDGSTANGGTTKQHTYTVPGVYRVHANADAAGSTVVTVLPSDPPCPALNDDFSGNALSSQWEILRPRLTGLDVAGGELLLLPYSGDMHNTTASVRNVLLQPAPAGVWTATTKFNTTNTATNDQAGIIMWRGEAPNNFAKIVFNRRSATQFWVERQNNINGAAQAGGGNAGLVNLTPDVYIRVSSDGAASPAISPEFSTDGTTWTPVQAPFQVGGSGPLKVGIAYWGPTGLRTGAFDYFHVTGATSCSDPDTSAPETTAALNPALPGPGGTYDIPVTVSLAAADEAAGSGVEATEYSVDGGAFQPYTGPVAVGGNGDHTVEYRSRDRAGNTEATKSVGFAIAQPEPTNIFDTIGITESANRGNSQINGNPTPYSLPAEEMPPSRSIAAAPQDELDDIKLRMPNTSGTAPNLAAFHGQTIVLRDSEKRAFSKLHFFGTTTDGGPAGGNFILTYSDNTTEQVNVQFRDWCNAGDPTAAHHIAIGPLSQRYRTSGSDGARCGIYHVPISPANPGKTLVSVKLPSSTTPGNPPIQSYLMALTLEAANGDQVTPDLGASPFPDDFDAPVTTATLDPADPQGQGGWYSSDVAVTLAAADETGGSGLDRIEYRVDGADFQPYTAAFTVSGEGAHAVQYRSRDHAGNVEAPKTADVKIDDTAPTVTSSLDPRAPSAGQWYDSAVRLTLAGDDGVGSGIGKLEYDLGGGWQTYSAPVMLDDAGVYTIAIRATDVAGHTADGTAATVKVDAAAPASALLLNGAAPADNYSGPVSVALSAGDGGGSGVAGIEYTLDDGPAQTYSAPFSISATGVHYLTYRARDVAGNLEVIREVAFRISAPVQGSERPTPEAEPWTAIAAVPDARSTLAAFRSGKLRVPVRCEAVEGGRLRLTVTRSAAKRLHLKSRTLAARAFTCDDGRVDVVLKPSRKVKRALAGRKGALRATLSVRTVGETGSASDTRRVVLRGGR